jgi:hypothetical protein
MQSRAIGGADCLIPTSKRNRPTAVMEKRDRSKVHRAVGGAGDQLTQQQ